jgi:hypothetical protein
MNTLKNVKPMPQLFLTITLLLAVVAVSGQGTSRHQPIEDCGWEVRNLSPPEGAADLDMGKILYLLTLDKNGKLLRVQLISSTMSEESETKWREQISALVFLKRPDVPAKELKYKGTLSIETAYCHPPEARPQDND